jgi:hypothetical protein
MIAIRETTGPRVHVSVRFFHCRVYINSTHRELSDISDRLSVVVIS